MKYPGKIKAGTRSKRMLCTLDILPTVAHLAGAKLPANEIDGRNVWGLIRGKDGAKNPHEYYAFSTGRTFEGVISGDGKWKLHLPHKYRTLVKAGKDGLPGPYRQGEIGLSLFDMENDQYETTNVIEKYRQVAEKMKAYADGHKAKFYGTK
jgi:arylsulfatase A-like enzyme